jgi:hypothetical protein
MITSLVSALQIILILISSAIILYMLVVKGNDTKINCLTLAFNLCLLWMVLI